MEYRTPHTRVTGFTLMELMVTLAVLAVILGLAVPSFANLVRRNRLIAAANELVAAAQLARIEAVRRNRPVTLCPSTDGALCGGTDWRRLIIFADANRNRARDVATDELIRDVSVDGVGLVFVASASLASTHRLWFGADGFVRLGNPVRQQGAWTVCAPELDAADNARDITLAVSRVSVTPRAATALCTAGAD